MFKKRSLFFISDFHSFFHSLVKVSFEVIDGCNPKLYRGKTKERIYKIAIEFWTLICGQKRSSFPDNESKKLNHGTKAGEKESPGNE